MENTNNKKNNPSYSFGYKMGKMLWSTFIVCVCALMMGATAWLLRAMIF